MKDFQIQNLLIVIYIAIVFSIVFMAAILVSAGVQERSKAPPNDSITADTVYKSYSGDSLYGVQVDTRGKKRIKSIRNEYCY